MQNYAKNELKIWQPFLWRDESKFEINCWFKLFIAMMERGKTVSVYSHL